MSAFCYIGCLLFCFLSEAQILYFSSGIGTNSGARVTPYEGSKFLSTPWWLEAEAQFAGDKMVVSLYGMRKVNQKAGEAFLSGISSQSLAHYYGMKLGRFMSATMLKSKDIRIGFLISYGSETVRWVENTYSIFSSAIGFVEGTDRFDLAQAGIYSSIIWQKSRLRLKLSLSMLRDFILNGHRKISPVSNSNQSMYKDFSYQGLFSFNVSAAIGLQLARE